MEQRGQQFAPGAVIPPRSTEPPTPPKFKGAMCRCLFCCCKFEEGHNDPAWIAWEASQR